MAFTLIPASYVSTADISMSGTGTYDVAQIDGNYEFIPVEVLAICVDSNNLVGAVTCQVGTNSANYNNIMGAQILAGLNEGKAISIPLNLATEVLAGGSIIKCKVTLGLTLGTGTLKIVVNGYNKVIS